MRAPQVSRRAIVVAKLAHDRALRIMIIERRVSLERSSKMQLCGFGAAKGQLEWCPVSSGFSSILVEWAKRERERERERLPLGRFSKHEDWRSESRGGQMGQRERERERETQRLVVCFSG